MKKLLFLLVALLTNVGVWAFEVDGIQYTVVSAQDNTVEVTGFNSSYEGDLLINGTVTYNNTEYKVVSIKGGASSLDGAFRSCPNNISIGVLPYCTTVGGYAFYMCRNLTGEGNLRSDFPTWNLPSNLT